ncbi:MAG TPA: ATP12 family protein [Sphingobium sp.]
MKRFYTLALSERDAATGLHRFLLDGRPVKTPARETLAVPGETLAAAIVSEWSAQGEAIDPATMPVTGFANAAIDRVLPDAASFTATIAAYGANDLFCYRADEPAELVAEQAALWEPVLDWARGRYGVTFAVTSGIMPVNQPAETVERLNAAVDALDPWLLSAFSTLVSITGSLIGPLALVEGALTADALWTAVQVDEDWQARQWGEDAEAVARTAIRRVHYDDAARYCALVAAGPDTPL